MAKVQTYTGADGTLFSIAAREYGDATLWLLIAQANNLTDPMISGTVTLVIPDRNSKATGGIPTQ